MKFSAISIASQK